MSTAMRLPILRAVAASMLLVAALFTSSGAAGASAPAPARVAHNALLATAGQVEAGSVTPSVTPAPTPVEKAKKSPPGVGLAAALLIVGAAFWVSHWARSRRRRQPPPPD